MIFKFVNKQFQLHALDCTNNKRNHFSLANLNKKNNWAVTDNSFILGSKKLQNPFHLV